MHKDFACQNLPPKALQRRNLSLRSMPRLCCLCLTGKSRCCSATSSCCWRKSVLCTHLVTHQNNVPYIGAESQRRDTSVADRHFFCDEATSILRKFFRNALMFIYISCVSVFLKPENVCIKLNKLIPPTAWFVVLRRHRTNSVPVFFSENSVAALCEVTGQVLAILSRTSPRDRKSLERLPNASSFNTGLLTLYSPQHKKKDKKNKNKYDHPQALVIWITDCQLPARFLPTVC